MIPSSQNVFIRNLLLRSVQTLLVLGLTLLSLLSEQIPTIAKKATGTEKPRNAANISEKQSAQIYFITTRLNTGSEKTPSYSGERHLDMGKGTVEYGVAGLREPPKLLSPSTASDGKLYKRLLRQGADSWRNAPFTFVSKTDDEEFFKRLRDFTGTICIYIHGYDKPFSEAAQDACMVFSDFKQYEKDPQKKLLPLLFSWPSIGGRTEYGTDEANIEWSGPAFNSFLDRVLKEKNPDAQLDIVGHSMGVRLIINYLNRDLTNRDKPIFQNMFLCSGDVDFHLVDLERKLLDDAVANKYYVFVSDKDKAMILSHFIHEQPRLGRPIDPPKFTLAQRNQVFSSVYLSQIAVDASDVMGGNSYTEPPDVLRWIKEDPSLDQDFSEKGRLIDVTEVVTKDFGHGVAYSVVAAYMAGKGTPQLKEEVVHKRPDRTTLQQSGGTPKHLYRFMRLQPFTPVR